MAGSGKILERRWSITGGDIVHLTHAVYSQLHLKSTLRLDFSGQTFEHLVTLSLNNNDGTSLVGVFCGVLCSHKDDDVCFVISTNGELTIISALAPFVVLPRRKRKEALDLADQEDILVNKLNNQPPRVSKRRAVTTVSSEKLLEEAPATQAKPSRKRTTPAKTPRKRTTPAKTPRQKETPSKKKTQKKTPPSRTPQGKPNSKRKVKSPYHEFQAEYWRLHQEDDEFKSLEFAKRSALLNEAWAKNKKKSSTKKTKTTPSSSKELTKESAFWFKKRSRIAFARVKTLDRISPLPRHDFTPARASWTNGVQAVGRDGQSKEWFSKIRWRC